jgi:hypothetical protein
VTALFRLDRAEGRSNVGVPVASAITISPDGRVHDGPVSTELVASGERAIMIWHDSGVDEALAAYLERHGQGHRLRPLPEADLASPRTEAMRVATPKHVRDWFAAEVAAGRIVPAEQLPPPAVRRSLREGQREPRGDNRGAYLSLLTSWLGFCRSPQNPSPSRSRSPLRLDDGIGCSGRVEGGWGQPPSLPDR